MIFTDIRLQNYRSYSDASFDLGSGVNIVVGPNAAGKTNLLEAIMVSSIGASYRAKKDVLIRHNTDWARIDVHTSTNQTRVVKIKQDNDVAKISFEFEEKPYLRLSQQHKHPVVLFEPNNLFLLHEEPSERRDYIDNMIEQYTPGFSTLRASYRRVVSQRNALLKEGSRGSSQMFAWNIRMAELADKIVTARLLLIERLQQDIAQVYEVIAHKKLNIKLVYESKTRLDTYGSSLLATLEENQDIDIERGFTTRGPHRDDIVAYCGDVSMVDSASRGEIRTLLLAIKIIELQLLEEKTNKRPLLLLDDVFSELDGVRRRALTGFLKNYQTIITTTDADAVIEHFSDDYTVIPVQAS